MPFLSAALIAVALGAPAIPEPEMRGLWVVRTALVSPEDVDRVVDQAAAAGLNALFVQVRGRGDAFYGSALVPRSTLLSRQPVTFDPLARLLGRARSRGLAVHAWFNVLLTAHFPLPLPRDHVLSRHPDWAMVPRSAARSALAAAGANLLPLIRGAARNGEDVEGLYLSPSHEAVHAHLEAVVMELVSQYPVDGLHLDFIRYPSRDYDYSRAALEGFARFVDRPGRDLVAATEANPEAWAGYRRGVLTALAARLSRTARGARPGLLVSAAVVPDEAQALHQKFQSWPDWTTLGIVDAICPMVYTPDTRLFRRQVEQALRRAATPVWVGVGSYRLSLDGTLEKIRAARLSGVAGVGLFSHESFAPEDFGRLRREVFSARGSLLGALDSGAAAR
jgi:uncharacterized lipoprotein YddW (UPF0748 family)